MQVKIERLDHQGRGISKVNGITTFIPNSLPGEEVDIEIIQNKKNYKIGTIKKYVKKSDLRINPICPHYDKCGGCDLQHMNYLNQLKFKYEKVKNIISRFTSIDVSKVKEILYSYELYYRNKATFQVNNKIGFFNKKSNEIVSVEKCHIVSNKINDVLNILNGCDLDGIEKIVVRTNDIDTMVIIKSSIISNEIREKLKRYSIIKYNKKYEFLNGNKYIKDRIGNYQFLISPDSFYQVNSKVVKKLYDKVLEYLNPNGNEKILDLYSGTGTIGIYVSKFVQKVISVEINKYAVNDAKLNAKINNVNNIEFICDDVANVIDKFNNIDSIIVDPPRAGLDDKTISYLKKISSNKIIYISCDVMTFARDLEKLSDMYDVIEITPVDMFPNTSHVECVCVLKRR